MTTQAQPAEGFTDQSPEYLEEMLPIITIEESMPAEAAKRRGRRPTLSIMKRAGKAA